MWLHSVLMPAFLRTFVLGGDERDRTADPLLARQVLSQLSYTPILGLHPQNPGKIISHYTVFTLAFVRALFVSFHTP